MQLQVIACEGSTVRNSGSEVIVCAPVAIPIARGGSDIEDVVIFRDAGGDSRISSDAVPHTFDNVVLYYCSSRIGGKFDSSPAAPTVVVDGVVIEPVPRGVEGP